MSDLEKKNVSTKGVKFPNPLIKSEIHTFKAMKLLVMTQQVRFTF